MLKPREISNVCKSNINGYVATDFGARAQTTNIQLYAKYPSIILIHSIHSPSGRLSFNMDLKRRLI